MTIEPARDGDTAPAPVPEFLRLHRALASLALATGPTAALGQHTGGRHLAFLPPEALELDLSDPAQRDFGDYELLEKIGQGGMGVVYRARQKALDREVAVKLLAAGPWASRDFIERFRREAQSAARMQHPGIVSIFEVGAQDDLNYFSMELVRGESLAGLLAREGALAPKRAAALLRTIAEAVDYAHRLGVLHLDLKPGNVLMGERGEPRVADFGLARRLDETLASDSDEVSGTPSYMAPEQAVLKSHKLSPATDVYGLGAILYELLTGRPPFLGPSPQATLQRVVEQPVARPRTLVPSIPADLEATCLKCLEKDPAQRYPDARALAADLAAFLDDRPVSVRPLGTLQRLARAARREPRLALAAGAFVLALASGLVATALQWRRADANASDARDHLWRARAAAAQAALANGDGFRGLRPLVQNLTEMEAAGRAADAALERQRIGTILANAPRLVDFIRLPQGEAVTSVAIAPGGRRFAVASSTARSVLHVRQFDTADLGEDWHAQPIEDRTLGQMGYGPMRYSPDGARLVLRVQDLYSGTAKPQGSRSVALDARSGRFLQPPAADDLADVVYSDDATHALVRYATQASSPPDEGRWFAVADWQALGPRVSLRGYDQWLPSPDGRWLVGAGTCCRVTVFEPASLSPRWHVDLPEGDPVRAWRFSADGALLALGASSGAVHLVDTADGSHAALPATASARVGWLEFSEDAATLAVLDEAGGLTAFDMASRKARATPLRTAAPRGAWNVRLAGDSMLRSVGTQLERWEFAPPAPFDNEVVADAARIRSTRVVGEFAFDLDPADGSLIVGGSDGKIGRWRLPPSVLLQASAPPLPATTLQFDGLRIVAVDGNTVQLLDAATRAPLSAPLRHPDAVQFAELAVDGGSLVTVAGRTVRVFDPASGSLRGSPIVLPGTPLHADLARAAPVLVLGTGEYDGDRFNERLHVVELDSGRRRAHSPVVHGPLVDLRIDPLGRYAMATRFGHGDDDPTVGLVDLTGAGRSCHGVEVGPDETLDGYRTISPDGRSAWIGVNLGQRRTRLVRWGVEECRVLASAEAPLIGTHPTLVAHGEGVVAHRLVDDALAVFDGRGARRDTAGLPLIGSTAELAVSRAGDRAALATRNAVLIVDLVRGERLSALLAAPIAGNDAIAQLAFSPDSTTLLGRTIKGRWLLWSLPVATQDAATLATLAALLDPVGSTATLETDAVDALRRLVRASLPAPPAAAPAPPHPAIELAAAADAGPDPRFVALDLAPTVNAPLNGAWPTVRSAGGELVTLAPGMQRLNGIDWRIEGGVQLSSGSGPIADNHPPLRQSALIPVPVLTARRVHALLSTEVELPPDAPPRPMAQVVLLGADGRLTALPIHTRRHVAPTWQPHLAEPSARIAWVGPNVVPIRVGAAGLGGADSQFGVHAVSLEVPPGTGPVTGVRLEIGEAPVEAPLFYALTLERDPPAEAP